MSPDDDDDTDDNNEEVSSSEPNLNDFDNMASSTLSMLEETEDKLLEMMQDVSVPLSNSLL